MLLVVVVVIVIVIAVAVAVIVAVAAAAAAAAAAASKLHEVTRPIAHLAACSLIALQHNHKFFGSDTRWEPPEYKIKLYPWTQKVCARHLSSAKRREFLT